MLDMYSIGSYTDNKNKKIIIDPTVGKCNRNKETQIELKKRKC